MSEFVLRLWRKSWGSLRWLRRMRRGWLGLFVTAWRNTFSLEYSLAAAALAYFSLFSFFPLLIFTTLIASTWLEPVLDRSEIVAQLDFLAPALGYLLQNHLQRIVGMEQTITGISVLSLIWSSSSIFYVLTRTLDRIWNVDRRRPMWQHRGMALGSVVVIAILLLLASVAHGTVVTVVGYFTPSQLQQFTRYVSQGAAIVVGIMLFALLYRFLPHSEVHWRDIWPGALVGGLLWEMVKRVFFFYATTYLAKPNLTELIYGSMATIIAFLGWAYASSIIFIFGAHFNVGYCRRQRAEGADQIQGAPQ